jgi:large conductance mechanosensitive channel
VLKGFRDFVLRGNVVDLAVAVIIGAAFNAIVNAMVGGVLNPLIAATIGKPDFSNVVWTVRSGKIQVGTVFNAAISFFIVATVVYFCMVMPMHYFLNRLKKNDPVPPLPPATKTCTECLSEIPLLARRCAHCAQPQPVPEPAESEVAV